MEICRESSQFPCHVGDSTFYAIDLVEEVAIGHDTALLTMYLNH